MVVDLQARMIVLALYSSSVALHMVLPAIVVAATAVAHALPRRSSSSSTASERR